MTSKNSSSITILVRASCKSSRHLTSRSIISKKFSQASWSTITGAQSRSTTGRLLFATIATVWWRTSHTSLIKKTNHLMEIKSGASLLVDETWDFCHRSQSMVHFSVCKCGRQMSTTSSGWSHCLASQSLIWSGSTELMGSASFISRRMTKSW